MFSLPEIFAVSDVGLALISGGSAVAGALVGGSITGFFSLKSEEKRQEFVRSAEQRKEAREDQATLAVARGAAREWAHLLRENRLSIAAAITSDHWWPSDSDVERFSVHDDRKLVASMLSPEDFDVIERAESSLYNQLMLRDGAFEGLPGDAPFPRIGDQAEGLRGTTKLLASAEQVLRSIGNPGGSNPQVGETR
jgi:hypothetical protein